MQFSLCIRIKQQKFCLQTKRHKVVFLSAALAVCSTLFMVRTQHLASIPKSYKCVDREEGRLETVRQEYFNCKLLPTYLISERHIF
jgi:hypothetical protein